MSYLFIKICFKEKSLYYFHKKLNIKKPKTNILLGFLGVFLGVFWWVFWVVFFIGNPAVRWPACWWGSDRRCGAAVVCC